MLNLKALLVVLVLAGITFHFARPICLRYVAAADFDRRRNVWLCVTVMAFVSPSYWIYVAGSVPLMIWAGRRDANPGALFLLLLYTLPPFSVQLPVVGIGQLFDLNQQRLLSLTVLLPAAFSPSLRSTHAGRRTFDSMYGFLLAYAALVTVLFMPVETFTTTLRRSFLFLIDTVLLYHLFRVTMTSRVRIAEALLMYGLACAVMVPIAVFETLRGWLLYQGITEAWTTVTVPFTYLLRGGLLRAQASSGHALTLGYLMSVGFAVFLYFVHKLPQPRLRWILVAWIWAGLIAALSRAPWLTAVVIWVVFLALDSRGLTGMVKTFVIVAGVAAIVAATPLGKEIIAYLPFVGTIDSGNIDYRQALWDTSVELIKQSPLFGSPYVLSQMEHLRQGQGIIDLVNGYLVVALYYGLVGLALFAAPFLIGLAKAYRTWLLAKKLADRELCLLGACLIASMIGTLFFVATAGFGPVLYVLAAMIGGYAGLKPERLRKSASVGESGAHRTSQGRSTPTNGKFGHSRGFT
jgi:hypothetical protein